MFSFLLKNMKIRLKSLYQNPFVLFSEMYQLVEFEDGDIAVMPDTWEFGDGSKIYWPPYKNPGRLNKAVKNRELPDLETWTLSKVERVLYTGK